jgi:hypothetical protein
MRAAKTSENGLAMLVAGDISTLTLARRPDGHARKPDNTALDESPIVGQCGGAMTTAAYTRVPTDATLLSIVILILPL